MNSSTLPFLHDWYGAFAPQLTAIAPDGPILAQRDRSWDDTAKFVIAHDGARNLYYSVNVVRTDKIGKASKGDITHALGCHCDLDYRVNEPHDEERQRILALLQSFVPKPTVIVFSGGGFNALWKFREPIALATDVDRDAVEAANRALEYALGGDHCHNVDRILRLVGSDNLPNARKRAKGRVKAQAELIEADWTRLYDLGDFPKANLRVAVEERSSRGRVSVRHLSATMPKCFADLGPAVHEDTKNLIRRGIDKRFPSRSEALWHVVCQLVRDGVPDEMIVGTIMHPSLGISASVIEKPDPLLYASRQVIKAREVELAWQFEPDPEMEAAYEALFV